MTKTITFSEVEVARILLNYLVDVEKYDKNTRATMIKSKYNSDGFDVHLEIKN